MTSARRRKGFGVAAWMDHAGGIIERHPSWWVKLGSIETGLMDSVLPARINHGRLHRPLCQACGS